METQVLEQSAAPPVVRAIAKPPAKMIAKPTSPLDNDLLAQYKKLKQLFTSLKGASGNIDKANENYKKKREETAILCHDIWVKDKSQGDRSGGGFEVNIKNIVGVDKNKAYRLMEKFFTDTPQVTKPRSTRAKSKHGILEISLPGVLQAALPMTEAEQKILSQAVPLLGGEVQAVHFMLNALLQATLKLQQAKESGKQLTGVLIKVPVFGKKTFNDDEDTIGGQVQEPQQTVDAEAQ